MFSPPNAVRSSYYLKSNPTWWLKMRREEASRLLGSRERLRCCFLCGLDSLRPGDNIHRSMTDSLHYTLLTLLQLSEQESRNTWHCVSLSCFILFIANINLLMFYSLHLNSNSYYAYYNYKELNLFLVKHIILLTALIEGWRLSLNL